MSLIYHSPPGRVRVTIVGVFNDDELSMGVSRCGKDDSFMKKSIDHPARPSFEVDTSKGTKIVPGRDAYVEKGGIQRAKERLASGDCFTVDVDDCSIFTFLDTAEDIAKQIIADSTLVSAE